jgi:hypothetical protein
LSATTNKNTLHDDASFLMPQDVSTIIRKYFLSS